MIADYICDFFKRFSRKRFYVSTFVCGAIILASIIFWYITVPDTQVSKAVIYTKITNRGSKTQNASFSLIFFPISRSVHINLSNVNALIVDSDAYNVTIVHENEIRITLDKLKLNSSVLLVLNDIEVSNYSEGIMDRIIEGIYLSDGLEWDSKGIILYASNDIFPIEGEYVDLYRTAKGEKLWIYGYRFYTREFYLLSIILSSLIICGVFLCFTKTFSWSRYPFVTFSILLIDALIYVFAGTISEVSLLPSLRFLKEKLPISIIYHKDYTHIVGNFVYFGITSFLAETWLNIRRNFRTALHYIIPYTPDIAFSTFAVLTDSTPPCGLSIASLFLSISLIYYVIKHQRAIIFSNANIFCVMLISAPIFSAFLNWLIVLLFFRRIYNVYYHGIAAYHVLCGILGFLSIIILHIFDRLKKTKIYHL